MNERTTLSSHLGNKSLNPLDRSPWFIKFSFSINQKPAPAPVAVWLSTLLWGSSLCGIFCLHLYLFLKEKKCCNWLNWLIDMSLWDLWGWAQLPAASLSCLHSDVSLAPHQRFAYAIFNPAHPLSCSIPGQILSPWICTQRTVPDYPSKDFFTPCYKWWLRETQGERIRSIREFRETWFYQGEPLARDWEILARSHSSCHGWAKRRKLYLI